MAHRKTLRNISTKGKLLPVEIKGGRTVMLMYCYLLKTKNKIVTYFMVKTAFNPLGQI